MSPWESIHYSFTRINNLWGFLFSQGLSSNAFNRGCNSTVAVSIFTTKSSTNRYKYRLKKHAILSNRVHGLQLCLLSFWNFFFVWNDFEGQISHWKAVRMHVKVLIICLKICVSAFMGLLNSTTFSGEITRR